jgi:hypothetical protein
MIDRGAPPPAALPRMDDDPLPLPRRLHRPPAPGRARVAAAAARMAPAGSR